MLLYNITKVVKLHNKYTNKRNTMSTVKESDFALGISKQWFVLGGGWFVCLVGLFVWFF